MKKRDRITQKFAELKSKGQKGLITFITAGDPHLDKTGEIVLTLEKAGADFIELGVPFSDPLADGPVIQQASQRALQAGTNLTKILSLVKTLRKQTQIPIILMTYFNPLLRYGLARLGADAAAAGVDGFIVPDLPFEETGDLAGELKSNGLCLIPLVAPTSGEDRIQRIAKEARGFLYCVSLTGVTGVRAGLPQNLQSFMETVRRVAKTPVAIGFGISGPAQAAQAAHFCDAVIVGSALVKTIGEMGGQPSLLDELHKRVSDIKSALETSTGSAVLENRGILEV